MILANLKFPIIMAVLAGVLSCSPSTGNHPHGHSELDGYVSRGDDRWNKETIPVCYEQQGFEEDKENISDYIRDEFAKVGLYLGGWAECDTETAVKNPIGIRVTFTADSFSQVKNFGNRLNGVIHGVSLGRNHVCSARFTGSNCQRNVALHEFGHAIGLHHEMNRRDDPGCRYNQVDKRGEDGAVQIGDYDAQSIMSYCELVRANRENRLVGLSDADKQTILARYTKPMAWLHRSLSVYHVDEIDHDLFVVGSGVNAYRFKLGALDDIQCKDPAGYSPLLRVDEPIDRKHFNRLPRDARYRLCLLGHGESGQTQPMDQYTSVDFEYLREPSPRELMVGRRQLRDTFALHPLILEEPSDLVLEASGSGGLEMIIYGDAMGTNVIASSRSAFYSNPKVRMMFAPGTYFVKVKKKKLKKTLRPVKIEVHRVPSPVPRELYIGSNEGVHAETLNPLVLEEASELFFYIKGYQNLEMFIYSDPEGTEQVAFADNRKLSHHRVKMRKRLESGTYYVRVNTTKSNDFARPFDMDIAKVPVPVKRHLELGLNEEISGDILHPFILEQKAEIEFVTEGEEDLVMTIFADKGRHEVIAFNDNSGPRANPKIMHTLEPGTYYVLIEHRDPRNFVRPTNLKISVIPPKVVTQLTLGLNADISANTFHPFILEHKGDLIFETKGPLDLSMSLYVEGELGKARLDFDDDSGEGRNSLIRRKLEAGLYYLFVKRYWKNHKGSIDLEIRKAP